MTIGIAMKEKMNVSMEEMEEIIVHDLSGARQYHDDQMSDISTWMDEYNAEPYGNEADGRSKIVWSLIKKQGEALISNIIKPFAGNFDIVNIDPMTEADVYKSKINEKLINHYWNKEFSPLRFLKQLGKVMVPEGTVFIRIGWDNEYKERREKIPMNALTNEMRDRLESKGAELIEKEDGSIEIIVRQVLTNNPTAKIVRTEDIYLDPTADSFDDCKFIIYEMRTSLGDIVGDAAYDENAVKRLRQVINSNDDRKTEGWDEHDYNVYNFEFSDEARKKVTLYEYWGEYDINGDGHLEPIVCTMAKYGEENIVLKMKRNPFPFKRPPFVCIPLYDDPFKPYGRGLADAVSDEQKLSTSIVRGMIDNMANSNNGMKFFKKGALDATNFNRLKRGDKYIEVNTSDSINTAVMDGNFNQLPSHIYNMLQLLDSQAESLTGISKAMQGVPGSEVKASSSNFAAMMTQSQIRLLDVTNNITTGLKEMFAMWLSMSLAYLDDSEVKRITGIDIPILKQQETQRLAAQLQVDQLPNDTAMQAMMLIAQEVDDMFNRRDLKYDIKIKVGTDGLKQIKIQNLNMLMQQLSPLAQVGSIPPEAIKLLVADLAEQLDRPDIAQMIAEYQPQPDPTAQKSRELSLAEQEANAAKDKALAENAMARTRNVDAKTKKDMAMFGAEEANKYADMHKKVAEVDQRDTELSIKAHEAGTKRSQADKPSGGN